MAFSLCVVVSKTIAVDIFDFLFDKKGLSPSTLVLELQTQDFKPFQGTHATVVSILASRLYTGSFALFTCEQRLLKGRI